MATPFIYLDITDSIVFMVLKYFEVLLLSDTELVHFHIFESRHVMPL